MTPAEGLQSLAEDVLVEDLAAEVRRLYAIDEAHRAVSLEVEDLRQRNHRAAVVVGDLRERLARAERRLDDLPTEAIANARRAAHFLGEGFVRIRHHSRGNYSAEAISPQRVTVRHGD